MVFTEKAISKSNFSTIMDYRIFIEKKEAFSLINSNLNKELKQYFSFTNLESYLVYDVFGISKADVEIAIAKVFSNAVTDIVHHTKPKGEESIGVEFLPGQYDQKADSAKQCLEILGINKVQIRSAELFVFTGLEKNQLEPLKKYLINPIEKREKDLSELKIIQSKNPEPIQIVNGFREMSSFGIKNILQELGLSLHPKDLEFIQDYFIQLKRDPTELEIRLLDTYWSDHCRHTTFEAEITKIDWDKKNAAIEATFNKYLLMRKELNITKPIRLMDLATIGGKYLIKNKIANNIDLSDEINACSIIIPVTVDGKEEEWLLQFKNETHNHPTEIEPYGGASTCIGGAIRDPLAGRAYVYQGIRLSGSASPNERFEDTMEGKLPQRKIIKDSAIGFSDYGNQIGVATSLVKEFYHPGYKAKHMEVGFVVGAVPKDWVRREKPAEGDCIVLVGGRTGRDGIGGAVGSSKTNENEKLEDLSAQVQKGNAIVESKIQRLFRKKEVLQRIKKCNDFGAGGISVAIGEIADSLDIDLDKVRLKYDGLNGLEIALSESQERMALVIEKKDLQFFVEEAAKENLEAYQVATVANHGKMIMRWNGEVIAELDREFLDSNGIRQSNAVLINEADWVEESKVEFSTKGLEEALESHESASQKGLQEMFDSNIGQATVLNPYGGYTQETPEDVSVHTLPVKGNTEVCSICSFGFNPIESEKNTYFGAYFSVIESINKLVAAGADLKEICLSFQEYFEKLEDKAEKWGRPFAALLGALQAQIDFGCPAIGGKDSMSGTYGDISVPPTLISFAIAPTKKDFVVSSTLQSAESTLYLYQPKTNEMGLIEPKNYSDFAGFYHQKVKEGLVMSGKSLDKPSIAVALFMMSVGNRVGVTLEYNKEELLGSKKGAVLFQANSDFLTNLDAELQSQIVEIGKTNLSNQFTINQEQIDVHDLMKKWKSTFEDIFPSNSYKATPCVPKQETTTKNFYISKGVKAKPKVLIPSFPGTNSEFDSAKAFTRAGAEILHHTFVNLDSKAIQESLKRLKNDIKQSQIIFFPGGFAAADEPDGSGKFIATILRNEEISMAIADFLAKDGLILGICNGFQALVQSGLLPFGKVTPETSPSNPILFRNNINRHQASLTRVKVIQDDSPWLKGMKNETYWIPISHGEGRFMAENEVLDTLVANKQIASVYVDCKDELGIDLPENPNGSYNAIEGIVSPCGKIYGRMGHPERLANGLFKNIPNIKEIPIFENAVDYFS